MIPELPTIEDQCDWWASTGAELSRQVWDIRRRVEEYVRLQTLVTTSHGTLEAQSAGWEWQDDEVALTAPDLVTAATVTFTGSLSEVERVMGLVLEEVPGMDFSVGHKIDHRAANRRVNGGGMLGARLAVLRTPKPAKVVVR